MTEPLAGPPLVLVSGPDDDGIAVLTLNRPEKKNALSIALREEAVAVLARLADDAALKVLVITGSGGCFSAGFDLREFAVTDPGHTERLWQSSDLFHHAVHRFPLPVIAAVDGIAYAGGFDRGLVFTHAELLNADDSVVLSLKAMNLLRLRDRRVRAS